MIEHELKLACQTILQSQHEFESSFRNTLRQVIKEKHGGIKREQEVSHSFISDETAP